jgi:small subunit ribosomal protein S16
MEVRIRLQKVTNTKKHYNYRLVAINRTNKRQGAHLEILGYYDPTKNPAVFEIKQEKIEQWIKKGAQMSDTVRSLVKKANKKK